MGCRICYGEGSGGHAVCAGDGLGVAGARLAALESRGESQGTGVWRQGEEMVVGCQQLENT